jgi:hypothetical protein
MPPADIPSIAERQRYALAALLSYATRRAVAAASDPSTVASDESARRALLSDLIASGAVIAYLAPSPSIHADGLAWTLDIHAEAVAAASDVGIPIAAGTFLAQLSALDHRSESWSRDLAHMPMDPDPQFPTLPSLARLRDLLSHRLDEIDRVISARRAVSAAA